MVQHGIAHPAIFEREQARQVNGDLARLAIFAAVRTVQHQDLVFTGLPVVNKNEAIPYQKPAVPVHFAHIDRIPRPVASRVRRADMAKPVQLSVRMPQQLGAGAGEKNGSPF